MNIMIDINASFRWGFVEGALCTGTR